MNWWQLALLFVVLWCIFILGGEYFLTGMKNDAQDEIAGQICGFGIVLIVGGAILLRKRALRNPG